MRPPESLQADHSIRALNGMWFWHTRPEDVDLFFTYLTVCGRNRIARGLTGRMSAQAGATAAQKNLIAVRSPKGITPALTSLRKERLNMCRPMNTAIPGFLP